jgi:hypothetical protein
MAASDAFHFGPNFCPINLGEVKSVVGAVRRRCWWVIKLFVHIDLDADY